jgi:hypothetical protein
MSLLPRLCLLITLAVLVSGCQTNPTVENPADLTPNAVAGDAIEVTALDAVPAAASAAPAAPLAAASAQGSATPPGEAVATAEAAPATTAPTEPAATTAATSGEPEAAVEAAPPPPPKSELQIACERKRGTWAATDGGLKYCVRATRDGGKRCTRESQCQGVCLARSQTCSPAEPLLGCHEILQDNGTRATLCIE